jgi:hypothetical protein
MKNSFVKSLWVVFTIGCLLMFLLEEVKGTKLRFVRDDHNGDPIDGETQMTRILNKYGVDLEMARTLAQYCAAVRSCDLRSLKNFSCLTRSDVVTACPYRPSTYAFDVVDVIDDMVADMTALVGANHEYSVIVVAFRGTATINNIFEDISVQRIAYPSTTTFKLRYTDPEGSRIPTNRTQTLRGRWSHPGGNNRGAGNESNDSSNGRVESALWSGVGSNRNFNVTVADNETAVVFLNGSLVHSGFYSVWVSVAPRLMNAIHQAKLKYPDYRIVFTGHSLGGAIASLGAIALRLDGTYHVDAVYTFGEPKLGNEVFAEFVQHFISPRRFRFVNHKDIVPHLPPEGLGPDYHHAGLEISLDQSGQVRQICDKHCKDSTLQGTLALLRYSVREHFNYLNVKLHSTCGLDSQSTL